MTKVRIFKPSAYPLLDREFDGVENGLICGIVHGKNCAFAA